MTNAELAERLNEEIGLAADNRVTVNVIRQWVAWDVLPKARIAGRDIGKGPVWSRSGVPERRARRLAELRQWKVKREDAVIVQAYLEWGHPNFERMQKALLRELQKWRAQLVRHRTTYIEDREYRDLGRVQKNAIRTQLGPLDILFSDTPLRQPDEFYAIFSELGQFGSGNSLRQHELMMSAIEAISPGLSSSLPVGTIAGFIDSFSGAMGDPDEIDNSAQSEIEIATEREFRIARANVRRIWRKQRIAGHLTEIVALPKPARELLKLQNFLSPQITVGPWAVMLFVQCLLGVRRNQKCPEIDVNAGSFRDFFATFLRGFDITNP